MSTATITGTGVSIPRHVIANDELVTAFNAYADRYNSDNAEAIEAGDMGPICSLGAGYSVGSVLVGRG